MRSSYPRLRDLRLVAFIDEVVGGGGAASRAVVVTRHPGPHSTTSQNSLPGTRTSRFEVDPADPRTRGGSAQRLR